MGVNLGKKTNLKTHNIQMKKVRYVEGKHATTSRKYRIVKGILTGKR